MFKVVVENDGEITLPEEMMRELGWRVGDDLVFERGETGLTVRRLADDRQET